MLRHPVVWWGRLVGGGTDRVSVEGLAGSAEIVIGIGTRPHPSDQIAPS
jgi:hypothetical protein